MSSPTKPPKRSTGRKGAKATSKPIPATDSMDTEGPASPSKKPAAKRGPRGRGKQIGNPLAVMDSVEIPVKKEWDGIKAEDDDLGKTEV